MKHTKHIISVLALMSVASSAFAATSETPAPAPANVATNNVATKPAVVVAAAPTSASGATTASADALNVPGAPSVVSQTATSVTLQWPKVDAAKTYIVKYAKNSVAQAFVKGDMTAIYDDETDQVTSTGTTISGLKTDTTYYFTVVALDAAKNESTTNSEELSVKLTSTVTGTGATATATGTTATAPSSLKLSGVTVMNDKTITVDFSAPLSSSPVSVKLTKSSDNSSVTVASVVTDPAMSNRVIVNLGTTLSPSSSYSIIVIDAADVQGLPIAEGVNAVKEFATLATLAKAASGTPDAVVGTGAVDPVTLNAAPETGSGVVTATTAEALPATGAKENILLLVAALLAMVIVYAFQKKRA